jgi:hypothetical protein
MAWHIIFFLKSLRSLEEFRKNPHVKISPKSPSTIFQSLAIIKKSNFIQKRIFPSLSAQSAQRPAGPSGLSAQPASLAPLFSRRSRARSAHPGLRGLGVFAKSRLLFEFAQPGDDAFSLCHRQADPTHQLHLPPSVDRSRPRRHLTSPLLATPRHPASTSRCRVKELTPPP